MAIFRSRSKLPRMWLEIHLNARVQPMHRGRIYEDPVEDLLKQSFPKSKVVESGSEFDPEFGVLSTDLGIRLVPTTEEDDGSAALAAVIGVLEAAGAPIGSYAVLNDGEHVEFGTTIGLGVHLNGTDLQIHILANNDINDLIEELETALGTEGVMQSFWEGPDEASLFFYGASEERMRERLAPVLATAPLAHQCRVTRLN